MGYYINLDKFSLNSFEEKLEKFDLLPSRMILKERLKERFLFFKNQGINSVLCLQQYLKRNISKQTLPEILFTDEYLKVLLREINSFHPKPNKIIDFGFVPQKTVETLNRIGISNTYELFDRVSRPNQRQELANETGIDPSVVIKLAKLTDLSRIKWVGATFANVLYLCGFDTVEKVANASPEEMYRKISTENKEKILFKGNIGFNDMKLCVQAAKDTPIEMIF